MLLRRTAPTYAALFHIVLAWGDFPFCNKWGFLPRSLRWFHAYFFGVLFSNLLLSSRNVFARHFLCSSWVTEHIDSQTSSLWQAACTNSCMPKQKLARKPPRTPGRQGQIQSRGPHDPEHQQGEGPQPENNRNSKPNAKVGGVRPKHK